MSIELVYGFAEPDVCVHLAEEELLVDYGIGLYSLEIINQIASKPFYGIQVILDSKIHTNSELTIDSDITGLLAQEDIDSVNTLYNKISKYYLDKSIQLAEPRLQIVYSTSFKFDTQPYTLREASKQETCLDPLDQTCLDPLAQMMKQAQTHIEEQVSSQKKIIEYLKSCQEESRFKFELVHNLPPKNFISSGNITPQFDLKIYDCDELVYHIKLHTSGFYDLANGFNGKIDMANQIVSNFSPDEDFLSELESWAYLYDDETIFSEVSEHLIDHLRDLVKE